MARLILKVVKDLSIFEKKGQRIGANASKNNYIATEKLEMRRPFAFPLFRNLHLVFNCSEFNGIRRFVCRLPFSFAFFSKFEFGSQLIERVGCMQHAFWQH